MAEPAAAAATALDAAADTAETTASADENSSTSTSAPEVPEVTPNHTLYLNNLNERVKREELKKGLYALFSQFGSILEINVSSAFRLRGQAWIVFKDVPSATKAMRDLQGFMFFDKQMRIQFAKDTSDPIAKIEGRDVDKDARRARKRQRDQEFLKEKTAKKPATANKPRAASSAKLRNEPPNAILFVENLPELANDKMLTALFSQYPGFKEVRMVPGKLVAFVEYENEMQSTVAMSGLQLFKMSAEHALVISYAKR